jgi:hypothetical protein
MTEIEKKYAVAVRIVHDYRRHALDVTSGRASLVSLTRLQIQFVSEYDDTLTMYDRVEDELEAYAAAQLAHQHSAQQYAQPGAQAAVQHADQNANAGASYENLNVPTMDQIQAMVANMITQALFANGLSTANNATPNNATTNNSTTSRATHANYLPTATAGTLTTPNANHGATTSMPSGTNNQNGGHAWLEPEYLGE